MGIRRWGDYELVPVIDGNPGFNGNSKGFDVAALENGGYVIAGLNYYDPTGNANEAADGYFQVYDAYGGSVTGLIEIDPTKQRIEEVAVTGLDNGNFVIQYTVPDNFDDQWIEIRTPTGGLVRRLRIDDTELVDRDPALVAVDGGFIAVITEDQNIWARAYDNDGTPRVPGGIGNGYVNIATGANNTSDRQRLVDVAVNNDGSKVAVSWRDFGEGQISYKILNPDLTGATAAFLLDPAVGTLPQIAAAGDSGFAITWNNSSVLSGQNTYLYFLDSSGAPQSSILVTSLDQSNLQFGPDIVSLNDGGVLVTWVDRTSTIESSIVGRIFDYGGAPRTGEFRLDFGGVNVAHVFAEMATLVDGRIALIWESDEHTLYRQIIDPRDGIIRGTDENDEIYGHAALGDEIVGLFGNDRLLGLAGSDTLYGDFGNDTLYGNNDSDQMFGGNGNDILVGGRGADVHAGGSGRDTAYYLDATSGVRASLANNLINTGWADGDTYLSIEDLTGTNHDDFLYGKAGGSANIIRGAAGDDFIRAYSGNDSLYGGTGGDILDGGLGADFLAGGTGFDFATYEGASARVTASLANASVNSGEADGDSYNSIEGLRGSRFNDILNGSNGDNQIEGWAGNDQLKGYRGWDTLTGGAGVDRFIFASSLGAGNLATITDFNPGVDKIRLYDEIFTAVGSVLNGSEFRSNNSGQAQDGSDHIIYNQSNGYLYYDPDGAGGTSRSYFARLEGAPSLGTGDFEIV